MGMFPCEHGNHRFLGKAARCYVVIMNGGQKWEHKPRLCQLHAESLISLFMSVHGLIDPSVTEAYEPQPCLVCAGNVDGQHPHGVFMTAYTGRGDRSDWFAPVCASCRPQAEMALKGL